MEARNEVNVDVMEQRITAGKKFMEEGENDKAFEEFSKALEIDPASEEVKKQVSLTDRVKFIVEKEEFICVRSQLVEFDYFKVLLHGEFEEKNKATIKVEGIEAKGFKLFLEYINGEISIKTLTVTTAIKLLPIADIFLIEPLKDACLSFIKNQFPNVCRNGDLIMDFLNIAITFDLEKIKTACLRLIFYGNADYGGYIFSIKSKPFSDFVKLAASKNLLLACKYILEKRNFPTNDEIPHHEVAKYHKQSLEDEAIIEFINSSKNPLLLQEALSLTNFLIVRKKTNLHTTGFSSLNLTLLHYLLLTDKDKKMEFIWNYLKENDCSFCYLLQDGEGNVPLHHAMGNGDLELALLLIKHSPMSVFMKNKKQVIPLDLARSEGHKALVNSVIDYFIKAELDNKIDAINNLLWWAGKNEFYDLFSILIKNGGNINFKMSNEDSFLHMAIYKKGKSAISFLCQNGADINSTNNKMDTPLHVAVSIGDYETVKLLLEKGADINLRNEKGESALHIASSKGYESIAGLLIKHGAKLNDINIYGETPLHRGAGGGNVPTVKRLLEAGGNPFLWDNNGKTPRQMAIEKKHSEELTNVLESAECKMQ